MMKNQIKKHQKLRDGLKNRVLDVLSLAATVVWSTWRDPRVEESITLDKVVD